MATSQAQFNPGTTIKFNGEVGADVAWSMEGVASAAGRVAAQYDFGAGPRDYLFNWYCELLMQATPTQYTSVDLYIASAPATDATQIAGDVGAIDAALGDVDMLHNLQYIGRVVIEEAGTTKMVGSGTFRFMHRYGSLVGHNNGTGATINATDSNFLFFLEPFNIQGQAT